MKDHFSSMAVLTVSPIMEAVCHHSFTQELTDGILPKEKFLYYMQQDALHLVELGRAFALLGSKLRQTADVTLALYFAEQGLLTERELHDFYFQTYQITPTKKKRPACFALGAHLLERVALGSPAEGMAALLPRFLARQKVSSHVRKLADADNPYFKWITQYSSKLYGIQVDRGMSFTDRLAVEAGEEERQNMQEAFIASARYEYAFCDDAYALRGWPV